MQPWYGPAHPSPDEPVIDLGPVDDPTSWDPPADAQPTPTIVDPPPTATRWLLVSVTVVVTVLATVAGMVLLQRATAESVPEAAAPPSTMDDLRAWVAAGAPAAGEEATLFLEPDVGGYLSDGVTARPGTYRAHLRCGSLGVGRKPMTIAIEMHTTAGNFALEMPCPSETLRMEHVLRFERLGAIWFDAYPATGEDGPPWILGLWLVPEATA